MPGRASPWYRRRWAPWAVVIVQATGGACAAGLAAAGISISTSVPGVCALGRDCGWQVALAATLVATLYFTASLVTAMGLGVSELAGSTRIRGRLVGAITGPPILWLVLTATV